MSCIRSASAISHQASSDSASPRRGEVLGDDPEIERDVVEDEVPVAVEQDELADAIGVDQAVLGPRAGGGQGQRRDLAGHDQGGLGVEAQHVAGERLGRPRRSRGTPGR